MYNSARPLHHLLPKSLEELHIFQIHDGLEFSLMSDRLCESLWTRILPVLSERQLQRLNNIIIEAPFEDRGVFVFEALSQATNQVGVKLTTIENSADYIRSWITGRKKKACPDKKICLLYTSPSPRDGLPLSYAVFCLKKKNPRG